MSWLQVVVYLAYLIVVMTLFLRPQREPARAQKPDSGHSTAADEQTTVAPIARAKAACGRFAQRWSRRTRNRALVAALLALPVLMASMWVVADYRTQSGGTNTVTVASSKCANDWTTPSRGATTYSVHNASPHAVDVEVVTVPAGDIVAEIEVLGPGTTRPLPVTLARSQYRWKCVFAGADTLTSVVRAATGTHGAQSQVLRPATATELAPALATYRRYVAGELMMLERHVATLRRAVSSGDRPAARAAWQAALLTYHRVGAAYDAFGADGAAIDGLASGLAAGVHDTRFVGLHRIEYGLWHNQPMPALRPAVSALTAAVVKLRQDLPTFSFDPNAVTIRAHEIIEDIVRFVLTGQSDYGCGCGYATATADLAGDRVLVDLLATLISARSPLLIGRIHAAQTALNHALSAGQHDGKPVLATPTAVRMTVDAAAGQLTETLASVPDLLEVRTP